MTGPTRKRPLPAPNLVRALFRYDGTDFYWLPRPREMFKHEWQWAQFARNRAGTKVTIKRQLNGYHGVRLNGTLLMVHRLIWCLHYGEWPKRELDHINGDKFDNRIENLRDVTKSMNMRNQKLRSDSTSGFPGVFFCKDHKAWRAIIRTQGVHKYLGTFKDREAAIAARKAAQVEYGYTANHGRAA